MGLMNIFARDKNIKGQGLNYVYIKLICPTLQHFKILPYLERVFTEVTELK